MATDETYDEAVASIDRCLNDIAQRGLVRSVGPMVTSWTLVLESVAEDGDRNIGLISADQDRMSDTLGHLAWGDVTVRDWIVQSMRESDG